MSSTPITGKISNVIDRFTVVLNIGKNRGVLEGMRFEVLGPVIKIFDPDTTTELGVFEYTKAIVEVTKVYDRYSLAQSLEKITEEPLPFPTFFKTRVIKKELPLETTPEVPDADKKIKVGDSVRQIL